MTQACRRAHRADLALLLTRIGVGTIFIAHALLYLQAGMGTLSFFIGDTLGFPLPGLVAWLVVLLELFGGLLLLLGLATPVAAWTLSAILVGIILTFKAKLGLVAKVGVGAELEIALLTGTLTLALQGAGWYAMDRWLRWFSCACDCCKGHPLP